MITTGECTDHREHRPNPILLFSRSCVVVPLHGQIPWKLQTEAIRIYGFSNNHTGTLNGESFLEQFARILEVHVRQ